MALGALIDAGLKFSTLAKELKKLRVPGYSLRKSRVRRGSLAGTKFDCVAPSGEHNHRTLKNIYALIGRSGLSGRVKARARHIFENIAASEARVHGRSDGRAVYLHELGSLDSIIDIVGIAIALDELGIDEVYASNVKTGTGHVRCAHGSLPVPAPATLDLLRGARVMFSGVNAELVTPTGAGILKALAKGFGTMPTMKVDAIGYGAGSREIDEMPNMLRVVIGEGEPAFEEDTVLVVETNIDDMNPQHLGYVFDKLFKAGALDVYSTPIQMKKTRPAFTLSVICDPTRLRSISRVMLRETTTTGVRFYPVGRHKLARRMVSVKTKYGAVAVKLATGPGGIRKVIPEYDDCARMAGKKDVPIAAIYDEVKRAVGRGRG